MGLDIGEAFQEGSARTFARNGLLLAAAFAVVVLLQAILQQTFWIGVVEAFLEWLHGASPQELGLSQQEYEQTVSDFETQLELLREGSPFALGLPLGAVAAGFVAIVLVGEAVSIVAVRSFGTDEAGTANGDAVTENLLLATLNGFIGKIAVYGIVLVGALFFLIPGIFFAIAFYFMRQEIALKNKNFVEAMADSWRLTRGHRIQVFALGLVLFGILIFAQLAGGLLGFVSPLASQLVTAGLRGVALVFGAAVATRAYVQLERDPGTADGDGADDPYDAALGPDDIPK